MVFGKAFFVLFFLLLYPSGEILKKKKGNSKQEQKNVQAFARAISLVWTGNGPPLTSHPSFKGQNTCYLFFETCGHFLSTNFAFPLRH